LPGESRWWFVLVAALISSRLRSYFEISSFAFFAAHAVRLVSSRRTRADFFAELILDMTMMLPNKSPEPTAVGAVRSAVAVHVTSRRWLSFFR